MKSPTLVMLHYFAFCFIWYLGSILPCVVIVSSIPCQSDLTLTGEPKQHQGQDRSLPFHTRYLTEGTEVPDFSITENPDYYDELRRRVQTQEQVEKRNGSSIYGVTLDDPSENATNSSTNVVINKSYRLAHIMAFLPFTSDGINVRTDTRNDAFTISLAVYHFNNIRTSPVLTFEDVEQCQDLKLTFELMDSEFSPIETTRTFTAVLQRKDTLQSPRPTAVIGTYSSAVTVPLAILTSVNDMPHISHTATAVQFDDKGQYPLFGRTVASTSGEAKVAVEFFKSIKSTHVAIVFVTDAYGSSLQKSFQDEANKAGIITESVALPTDVNGGSNYAGVIEVLKRLGFRHVYAILFETSFSFLEIAHKASVGGEGYLYVFPGLSTDNLKMETVPTGIARAMNGMGVIEMQGSVTTASPSDSRNKAQRIHEFLSGNERFRVSWNQALKNESFVQYVRDLVPTTANKTHADNSLLRGFAADPGVSRTFLYDAVTMLGLSMCRSAEATDFFGGNDIFSHFRELKLPNGASGRVILNDITGTRDYNSITFALWNTRLHTEENGNTTLLFVPSKYFTSGRWLDVSGDSFMYSNGMTVSPQPLSDDSYNMNYIGYTGRAIGYSLIGIQVLSSIISVSWVYWYRDDKVIASSQPLCLLMVSAGTTVMVATIIPLGMEETVASQEGLDIACQCAPWLYFLGTATTLSALVAKIKGVHRAYINPDLDFIHVTFGDILFFFSISFILNVSILLAWNTSDALLWTRDIEVESFNLFMVESAGHCVSKNAEIYITVLVAVNFGLLIMGNWWAYQARNIETEYNESTYIGLSMAAVLQAWAMGIPIIIVVWVSPPARYYVLSVVVFITSEAVLGIVYIPKVILAGKAKRTSCPVMDTNDACPQGSTPGIHPKRQMIVSNSESVGREEGQHPKHETQEPLGDHSAIVSQEPATRFIPKTHPTVDDTYPPGNVAVGSSNVFQSMTQGKGCESSHNSKIRASFPPPRVSFFVGTGKGNNLSDNLVGVRVLHNPRAPRNLEISGGLELSRKQLSYINPPDVAVVSGSHEDEVDMGESHACAGRVMNEEKECVVSKNDILEHSITHRL